MSDIEQQFEINEAFKNVVYVITRDGVRVSEQTYPSPDENVEEFKYTKRIAPKEEVKFEVLNNE